MLKKLLCAVAILCSSVTLAAPVKPLQILPHIIVPGGEFRVLVGRSCDGISGLNTRVWIGSRAVPFVGCEPAVSEGKGWLVLAPPLRGKQRDYAYAEGWQALTVTSELNDFTGTGSVITTGNPRNVQVIPFIDNLVASRQFNIVETNETYLSRISREIRSDQVDRILDGSAELKFIPKRFAYEKESRDSETAPLKIEGEETAFRAPAYVTRTGSIADTPVGLPDVCGMGKVLYQLDKFKSMNQLRAAGLSIEAAAYLYGTTGGLIGPATLGQPADTVLPGSGFRDPEERNRVSYDSVGLIDVLTRRSDIPSLSKVEVLILDSAASTGGQITDKREPKLIPIGSTSIYSVGHGSMIYQLIAGRDRGILKSRNSVKVIEVCGSVDCAADKVIQELCLAAQRAKSGAQIVVNVSFSSAFENLLLKRAIEAAVRSGVAVVTGYGNDDHCDNRNLTDVDYCNGYPADFSPDLKRTGQVGFYSVGAIEPHNNPVETGASGQVMFNGKVDRRDFQRGMESKMNQGRFAVFRETATLAEPDIYAPGQFWMKPIVNYSGRNLHNGMSVYAGTSFSAPLVTAIVAIWKEKCGQGKAWPQVREISRVISGMNLADASKCRWQDRKPTR